MFEFGKDLRKLFAQARESDDLGWLELIGADLVRAEARGQAIDAGRVSCARPFEAALRTCALWREHARRTGTEASLDQADTAALDAARRAATAEQRARAVAEAVDVLLLRYDLAGGLLPLERAESLLSGTDAAAASRSGAAAQALAAAHARLKARQARLGGSTADLLDAAALLDAALHGLGDTAASLRDELRLERAALALEAGVTQRDPRLLDQAGRDLRLLVQNASPDYRPVTRARALALCGAGMRALAALAGDEAAMAQGAEMFDAAADQFTPDHSPLDWVGVQLAAADETTPLAVLIQAERLCGDAAVILATLAREARVAKEVRDAEARGDVAALDLLASSPRRRLARGVTRPLDWASDQIALAHVGLAKDRLTGAARAGIGMMLVEAAAVAAEEGAPALAERARWLMRSLA